MTERCRYAGPEKPRVIGPEDDPQPCPERHCAMPWCPGRHVADDGIYVCPTCTRHVREDLEQIVTMTTRPARGVLSPIEVEALKAGVDSDAAVLAGPAADPIVWARHRRELIDAGVAEYEHTGSEQGPAQRAVGHFTDDNRDEPHQVWVLHDWDHAVREHLGHTTDRMATVVTSADYLDRQLWLLARDPNFGIDQMAGDIRAVRQAIENTTRTGDRTERGAPCPTCPPNPATGKRPLLVKHYEDKAVIGHTCSICGQVTARPPAKAKDRREAYDQADHCSNLWCWTAAPPQPTYGGVATADDDRWTCPTCHKWWTDYDYRNKVSAQYVQHAPALTASQIRATYRVPEGTVRRWASGTAPIVRTRGKDHAGRQLYDVADVKRARDTRARRLVTGEAQGA